MLLPPGRGVQLRQRDSRESTQPGGSRAHVAERSADTSPLTLQRGTHFARKRPRSNQAELIEAYRTKETARSAALSPSKRRHHSALGWSERIFPGETLGPSIASNSRLRTNSNREFAFQEPMLILPLALMEAQSLKPTAVNGIAVEQPQIVVNAIRDVVDQIRDAKSQ